MILDTNALSALADGHEDLEKALEGQHDVAVPTIVLGEYLYGIHQSRLRARYEHWLEVSLPQFQLLVVARDTARHYAEIRRELRNAGRPIPSNDLWIAALAREHRLPVVSRDRHFQAVPHLRLVTW